VAAEFGRAGLKVLLVDLDPQANASLHIGKMHPAEVPVTISKLLRGDASLLLDAIHEDTMLPNVSLIYSSIDLDLINEDLRNTAPRPSEELKMKLEPTAGVFDVIIIDTPPNTGDLLINALVAADHVIIPVETSYLGVSGLIELQRTIEQVQTHFKPQLHILGYLPTLCEEQRSEARDILEEMRKRYKKLMLPPIHKSSDLAYAHSSHMDVFTYRPPRSPSSENITSSSRATREYAELIEIVLKQTGTRKPAREG
jgi:chromosome partitioning protein